MIRRPPRSTLSSSSAASDVYKRQLRDYWNAYHPKEWLFYSRVNTGTHLTSKAVQDIFHKYINKTNITKKVTVHSIRHSFATHLLEVRTSIFHIKQLLGHSDISTTCFYLHLLKIESLNVVSPCLLYTSDAADEE